MASGVFKNYPNVNWSAQCKAQAYSGLDLLETTADLNLTTEQFRSLLRWANTSESP